MAQSIRDIICTLNSSLETVFKGGKFYGIALSVEREGRVQPVVNEVAVGLDDSYALQVYHKINGIAITYRDGVGRSQDVINTFSISAFIFNNEKITKLKTDEIAMIIQSFLASVNILSVRVLPVSVILNTQAIFSTEYRGSDFRLSETHSLMQFNYSVEIAFKSGCFDLCPEDFSQCKN